MNNQYHIIFPIDKKTKIVIPLKESFEWLGPVDQEDILLFHENKKNFLSKMQR